MLGRSRLVFCENAIPNIRNAKRILPLAVKFPIATRYYTTAPVSQSDLAINGVTQKYAEFSTYLDELSKVRPIYNKANLIKNLDQIYAEYQKILQNPDTRLNSLKLHDTNVTLSMFLKLHRLKRAHNVLTDLIHMDESLVFGESRDIDTVRSYLNVRCGAYVDMWYSERSYIVIDNTYVFDLIEYSLKNGLSYWDSEICYALSKSNQLNLLNQFTMKKWNISINESIIDVQQGMVPPSSEVIVTLMRIIRYIYKDGTEEANRFLNNITKQYPTMNLNINFWRNLLLEGSSPLRGNTHFKTGNENGLNNWRTMKEWYTMRNKQIPFDNSITRELYRVVERTKKIKDCIDIYTNCFSEFYNQRNKITKAEWSIINKYQKFILRRLINKKNSKRTEDFITQWSIDNENEKMLRNFVNYLTLLKNKKKVTQKYDEMIEDDMILGPLW
ncbi:ATPase expression protein [Maudiozyma exigua]|uniref:ATPase expression protein 2, mitochondrial n=1 Tax=Maudiozyma exigua TaxID=34358 RepID=A0A9P6WDW8_MAUEX|nr:ATPase expression protein [Kazachstania exigua]